MTEILKNKLDIEADLLLYTAQNNHFENRRDYISLSHCGLDASEIINQYENGFPDTLNIRLKCYKGYQMETKMLNRLRCLYGGRITLNPEIQAFDGKVKGHPDFILDSVIVGDFKSVLLDEWIPNPGDKVSKKIYYQMQGYMLYGNFSKAMIIYESRENGLIRVFNIFPNMKIRNEIHSKLKFIIDKIKWQ